MTDKLNRLRAILRESGGALVCFSGGVDSTFLLRVARDELGDRAVGLTAVSPAVPRSEVDEARGLATEIGARHLIVESREFDRPEFVANAPDRCYHCKTELLSIAIPRAAELGLAAVMLGTTVDDLGDHRPGLLAAGEFGAHQPMVDAGLTKADIRELSRGLGLRTWDKPQQACLSSRIPYGTPVTVERLNRVERFEEALHRLGFRQCRVRFHESVARLELEPGELARAVEERDAIVRVGREMGFTYVALDLAGFRSGAMNEVLRKPSGD